MQIQVSKKNIKNINNTSILQQTPFWSKIKEKQGLTAEAFDIKTKATDIYNVSNQKKFITDDFLILFQEIGNGYKIGYVPYGPTIEPVDENQGVFLEELSESLQPYIDPKCVMLRYDLLWESQWAKDDTRFNENDWIGPPEKKNQEIRLNFNTQNWNLKKANTNILPKDTIFIDLNKNEDQILKKMKAKTRYNIKLSQKKGVQIRKADLSDIAIWDQLYTETCSRNGIYLHDINYFRTVLETNAKETNSQVKIELLIAEIDHKPLAAMFLAYSGLRATYLYGASSSLNRNYMGTYLLQWEAIRRAKQQGYKEYDMFGVAPRRDPSHPMYGLYRFKTGFGGNMFHRMGCWDYPLDIANYELFLSYEMKSQGYRIN